MSQLNHYAAKTFRYDNLTSVSFIDGKSCEMYEMKSQTDLAIQIIDYVDMKRV